MRKISNRISLAIFSITVVVAAVSLGMLRAVEGYDLEALELKKKIQVECRDISHVDVFILVPTAFKVRTGDAHPLNPKNIENELTRLMAVRSNPVTGLESLMPDPKADKAKYSFKILSNYTYQMKPNGDALTIFLSFAFDPSAQVPHPRREGQLAQDMRYVIFSGARYRHGKAFNNYVLGAMSTQNSTVIFLDQTEEEIRKAMEQVVMRTIC